MADFIHTFLPAEGGDSRTLLVLHGTGGDENSLVPIARALAPTAAVLSPRGRVLENGMPRFFRRFAEGVFDYEDIKLRSAELAYFIAESASKYGFDAHNVWGVGYSNGANIAWSTMLMHPISMAGAVLFRSMLTLTDVPAPELSGKKIFVSDGRRDPIVAPANAEQLVSQMRGYGAEVELNWYEGGHELSREEILTAQRWFESASRS
jgi:phospholipase/carboxylesterase/glyoxalase family protein